MANKIDELIRITEKKKIIIHIVCVHLIIYTSQSIQFNLSPVSSVVHRYGSKTGLQDSTTPNWIVYTIKFIIVDEEETIMLVPT